jgi:hypothetical protein
MEIGSPSVPVLLVALALIGCQTNPPGMPELVGPASQPPAGSAGLLSPAESPQARQLYLNKCARCHKLYDPAVYSEAEWRVWMRKMSHKAKLDPGQEDLLGKYLDGFRAMRKP